MYELYETPKCLWIILELVNNGGLHHYMAQVEVMTRLAPIICFLILETPLIVIII